MPIDDLPCFRFRGMAFIFDINEKVLSSPNTFKLQYLDNTTIDQTIKILKLAVFLDVLQ